MSGEMNSRATTREEKLSQPQQNIGERRENVATTPAGLHHEFERLKTFPSVWNCTRSAHQFAADGFFFNDAGQLQCFFCHFKVPNGTELEGESVKALHQGMQNRCPLGIKFTSNVPINAQADQADDDQSLPADAEVLRLNLQLTPSNAIRRYEDRIKTFEGRWPLNRIQKAPSLARFGFSLCPDQANEEDPRMVKCYQCEVKVTVDDEKTAFELHQDAKPDCPLVLLQNTFSNEPSSNSQQEEEQEIDEEIATIQGASLDGIQNEQDNDLEALEEPVLEIAPLHEQTPSESQERVENALGEFDGEVENTQSGQAYQFEYQIPAQVHTGSNNNAVNPVPNTSNQQLEQVVHYNETHSIHPRTDFANRQSTFQGEHCPRILRQLGPGLAQSGFYYVREQGVVMCYGCGLLLKDWNIRDVPWKRHALSSSRMRERPMCPCVLAIVAQPQVTDFLEEQEALNNCPHPPKIARMSLNEEDDN